MHSSRMHTAHSLTISFSIRWGRRAAQPLTISCSIRWGGGAAQPPPGCRLLGCRPPLHAVPPGCRRLGCKPPPGCSPPWIQTPDPECRSPVSRITHRCKTLPYPKLHLRAVITENNDIIKVLFSKSISFSLIPPIADMSCYAFPGGCFVLTSETTVSCTLLEYFLFLVSWHYQEV